MPKSTTTSRRAPLEITASRHLAAWLADAGISLVFSTYQTNRLFLVGVKPDGSLSTFERAFDRPMGLAATADRLHLTTRAQIWRLDDALPGGAEHNGYDRVYVPRLAHTTGDVDAHDVAVDRAGRIVFVNTAYSCLAGISDRYSFVPLWKPPFISKLAAEDRCHLNGVAMVDGAPAYATAVSRSDVAAGWRDRREHGGIIIDVEDDEIVLDTLSMPHSPRVYREKLWVLNSGSGELGWVDRSRGRFEPIAFCPGFLRGLAFWDDFAIVGLSKPRHERTFSGLALDAALGAKDSEARCGVWVIDLRRGTVAHWLQLEGVVVELYDVALLPGVRRPMALGLQSDDIQRWITLDLAPAPILDILPARDPVPGTAPATLGAARRPASRAADAERTTAQANRLAAQALALRERGELADAIAHYEAACRLRPHEVPLLAQLGRVYYEHGELDQAARLFTRALEVDPSSAQAANDLGCIRKVQGNLDDALRLHARAAELDPSLFEAHENSGKIHEEQGRVGAARGSYQSALALRDDPRLTLHAALLCPPVFDGAAALEAYRRHAAAVLEAWSGRDVALPMGQVQSSRAEPPYDWAYHGRDNLALKRSYAALFTAAFAPAPPLERRGDDRRLHVGFVVTGQHERVFARCLGGIVTRLDRARFRVTLACARSGLPLLRQAIPEEAAARLILPARFDHAAAALRAADFDLLYFWEVGTDSTNYFLPFCRLAPVQCTGFGWPDTSGATALDFHLTSAALSDPETDVAFSESLVRLPHLPPYFFRTPSGTRPPSVRERFAPSREATLYVCPQNLRKMHPDFDAVLGGILRADPRGVVLAVEDTHPALGDILRRRWAAALPDVADRIRLLPRLRPDAYLQLVASADVILDTLHFGGAISSYDAFAAGVPVVTLPGALPRGRYAAAMYRTIGLDDGVATSVDDYIARAVRIAGDRPYRERLSAAIADGSGALFENHASVVQLEEFFIRACAR
jgi:uncharacterized protein (TIGR03032 family)